jgi:hypothetical protein
VSIWDGGWPEQPEEEREGEEPWRGDLHPDESDDDWPEYLAGPEYWLYKKWGDGGGEGR